MEMELLKNFQFQNKRIMFSREEKELLVAIISQYADVVECKRTNANSVQKKRQCWEQIQTEFNSQPNVTGRYVVQLQKCWDNLKTRLKKKNAQERTETFATGGGPPKKPTPTEDDDLMDQVGSAVPHITHRDDNPFDSDNVDVINEEDSQNTYFSQAAFATDSEVHSFQPRITSTPDVPEVREPDVNEPSCSLLASQKFSLGIRRGPSSSLLNPVTGPVRSSPSPNSGVKRGTALKPIARKNSVPINTHVKSRNSERISVDDISNDNDSEAERNETPTRKERPASRKTPTRIDKDSVVATCATESRERLRYLKEQHEKKINNLELEQKILKEELDYKRQLHASQLRKAELEEDNARLQQEILRAQLVQNMGRK